MMNEIGPQVVIGLIIFQIIVLFFMGTSGENKNE